MIHTAEYEGRLLHGILFKNRSTHLVWMVGSWTPIPDTDNKFFDWAAYIGAAPEEWSIEASMASVATWGAKLDERAARAYFDAIAERYGAEYRP